MLKQYGKKVSAILGFKLEWFHKSES